MVVEGSEGRQVQPVARNGRVPPGPTAGYDSRRVSREHTRNRPVPAG